MSPRALVVFALLLPKLLPGQADFRVYNEHPRLFLTEERQRRLERIAERNTDRWRQLQTLIESGAPLAEPPLVQSLIYRATDSDDNARLAIEWALGESRGGRFDSPGSLRLGAIVFDWCYDALSAEERKTLAAALGAKAKANSQLSGRELGAARDGLLASIATAGDWDGSEPAVGAFLEHQWAEDILPLIQGGQLTDWGEDLIAIGEISHVVRYNLERDLWLDAAGVFADLPMLRILGSMPGELDTPEGKARRLPFWIENQGRDLAREAVLGRIAEMILVGYETTARDFQFLQGWLRNDSYTLKGPLGTPYELLWLNPYLPGLSPASGQQIVYDSLRGRLFGRTSWDSSGAWFGFLDGKLHTSNEAAVNLKEPIATPGALVVAADDEAKLQVEVPPGNPEYSPRIYLVGLSPERNFNLRLNRGDWQFYGADRSGIIVVRNDPNGGRPAVNFEKKVRIEIRPSLEVPPGRTPRPSLDPSK